MQFPRTKSQTKPKFPLTFLVVVDGEILGGFLSEIAKFS